MSFQAMTMRMRTELVIFDFDGTLADTRHNIVLTLTQTLSALCLPSVGEADCAATIGLPLREAFIRLCPDISDSDIDRCVVAYSKIFEINRRKFAPRLFGHVAQTLRILYDRGVRMSIASSRSRKSLVDLAQEMGIGGYMECILGADDVRKAKPDPEPVLLTLERLGCSAENTLVVGDMPFDIRMGADAGTFTCGVTYGNATREQLSQSGADYIIDDFASLLQITGS